MTLYLGHSIDFANHLKRFSKVVRRCDLSGERHSRLTLVALRMNTDNIDFLSHENIGHIAQQSLPVIGQNVNIVSGSGVPHAVWMTRSGAFFSISRKFLQSFR